MRFAAVLCLLAVVSVAPADAQLNSEQPSIRAAAALRSASGIPAAGSLHAVDTEFTAAREFSSRAPGATLMIIGAAALVAGILVDGDGGTILILGGIGLGAYGFYLYTR